MWWPNNPKLLSLKSVVHGLELTALSLLIVIAVGMVAVRLNGVRMLSVQTASMVPTIEPKDAVFVRPESISELHEGDIITYHDPRQPNLLITHRFVSIDKAKNQLITAGDASNTNDPAFDQSLVMGRAVALAPRLGWVLDFVHQPTGLAITIYLPALMVILHESTQLAHVYARPFYSVRL